MCKQSCITRIQYPLLHGIATAFLCFFLFLYLLKRGLVILILDINKVTFHNHFKQVIR